MEDCLCGWDVFKFNKLGFLAYNLLEKWLCRREVLLTVHKGLPMIERGHGKGNTLVMPLRGETAGRSRPGEDAAPVAPVGVQRTMTEDLAEEATVVIEATRPDRHLAEIAGRGSNRAECQKVPNYSSQTSMGQSPKIKSKITLKVNSPFLEKSEKS